MAKRKTEHVDSAGVVHSADDPRRTREFPDPTPLAPPVNFVKSPSLFQQMRDMIRHEMSQRAAEVGLETLEEADDFDVPDDPVDPSTPYEAEFEPVSNVVARRNEEEEAVRAAEKAAQEARASGAPQAPSQEASLPGASPAPSGPPPGAPSREG